MCTYSRAFQLATPAPHLFSIFHAVSDRSEGLGCPASGSYSRLRHWHPGASGSLAPHCAGAAGRLPASGFSHTRQVINGGTVTVLPGQHIVPPSRPRPGQGLAQSQWSGARRLAPPGRVGLGRRGLRLAWPAGPGGSWPGPGPGAQRLLVRRRPPALPAFPSHASLHLESCTPGTRWYKVVCTGTSRYVR